LISAAVTTSSQRHITCQVTTHSSSKNSAKLEEFGSWSRLASLREKASFCWISWRKFHNGKTTSGGSLTVRRRSPISSKSTSWILSWLVAKSSTWEFTSLCLTT